MKYCVVKNTLIVIDGSENLEEVMYENALSAGFTEDKVEILTEEEYQLRVSERSEQIILSIEERLEALETLMMGVI